MAKDYTIIPASLNRHLGVADEPSRDAVAFALYGPRGGLRETFSVDRATLLRALTASMLTQGAHPW